MSFCTQLKYLNSISSALVETKKAYIPARNLIESRTLYEFYIVSVKLIASHEITQKKKQWLMFLALSLHRSEEESYDLWADCVEDCAEPQDTPTTATAPAGTGISEVSGKYSLIHQGG